MVERQLKRLGAVPGQPCGVGIDATVAVGELVEYLAPLQVGQARADRWQGHRILMMGVVHVVHDRGFELSSVQLWARRNQTHNHLLFCRQQRTGRAASCNSDSMSLANWEEIDSIG